MQDKNSLFIGNFRSNFQLTWQEQEYANEKKKCRNPFKLPEAILKQIGVDWQASIFTVKTFFQTKTFYFKIFRILEKQRL